jgi:hypothetical protein
MTSAASQGLYTGTFAGALKTPISILVGSTTTTVTPTGVGTITVTAQPAAGSTLVVGGVTYTFEQALGTCPGGDHCIYVPTNSGGFGVGNCYSTGSGSKLCTTAQWAGNILAALEDSQTGGSNNCNADGTGNGECFAGITSANAAVTPTLAGSVVTMTVTAAELLSTTGTTNLTLFPTSGGMLAAATGCSGTAATIAYSANTGTEHTELNTALGDCSNTGFYAAVNGANAVNVTDDTFGYLPNTFTVAGTVAGVFTWSAITAGGNGTNSCTSQTAGTYELNAATTTPTTTTAATNLANEIATCNTAHATIGATAAPATAEVTLTADTVGPSGDSITTGSTVGGFTWAGTSLGNGLTATVQPNAYPAKYGASLTTASCANDFVVYPAGQPGGTALSTIIAYNNIYVGASGGCETTNPTAYWAYNTGTGEMVSTSPIISPYGDQVAFIQSNGNTAQLVLLKWSATSGGSITAPAGITTAASGAAYRSNTTCPAACMLVIPFGDGNDDTISSPYYDWNTDTIFVGDDSGNLHEFTGAFIGTPAENTTSPWPVVLNAGTKISSPVFEDNSGYAFVGDMAGNLYSVNFAGTIHGTASGIGDAIADAPLIDGTQGTVYTFVNKGVANYVGYNSIFQFPTTFTGLGSPGEVALWYTGDTTGANGSTGNYLYAGSFDNVFYQSTTGTGNLYVVADTLGTSGATLYDVGVSNGDLSGNVTAVAKNLSTSGVFPWPSPLTEFCSGTCTTNGTITNGGGTDYVFFSVNEGKVGGCSGAASTGCILSYNVDNPTAVALASSSGDGLAVTTPASPGCWATGGLVIDNDATNETGDQQIYFVKLNGVAAGGQNGSTSSACAVGSSAAIINAVQTSQLKP